MTLNNPGDVAQTVNPPETWVLAAYADGPGLANVEVVAFADDPADRLAFWRGQAEAHGWSDVFLARLQHTTTLTRIEDPT